MYSLTLSYFFYLWTERSSSYETSRFHEIYSHSTSESVESQRLWLWFRAPSAFLLCLMLPCSPASNVVSGLPDYNICRLAAPPPQKVSASSYTTTTQTYVYDMTSLCMFQNHATHLLPSPRPSANHVQVLLSGRAATAPGMKESPRGNNLQWHSWPRMAKRSVEWFDFHFQRRWPACGQSHHCWPLLDKVTEYGTYHPALVLWSLHTVLFFFLALLPLGEPSLSAPSCSSKCSNHLLLTSKGK